MAETLVYVASHTLAIPRAVDSTPSVPVTPVDIGANVEVPSNAMTKSNTLKKNSLIAVVCFFTASAWSFFAVFASSESDIVSRLFRILL